MVVASPEKKAGSADCSVSFTSYAHQRRLLHLLFAGQHSQKIGGTQVAF
jgi:hypothetical protein